jgi:hypothetical protein
MIHNDTDVMWRYHLQICTQWNIEISTSNLEPADILITRHAFIETKSNLGTEHGSKATEP